jgi:hypothetical protein
MAVLLIGNNMFFTPDNIHLTQDGGYELCARKLKPVLDKFLSK